MNQPRVSHPGQKLAALACLAAVTACSAPAPARDGSAPAAGASGDAPAVVAAAEPALDAPPALRASAVAGAEAPTVTVYKTPSCGCCRAWVDHMRENGFRVVAIDTNDVDPVKAKHGVRPDHASCHTAVVGDYVLEGHVPAADVRRLLAERPAVAGLAVPGMPMGSPGMEGPRRERYDVLAFERGGNAHVFASH